MVGSLERGGSAHAQFILRYPKEVKPGSVNDDIVLNLDFASLFLDVAGAPIPDDIQGQSFRHILQGHTPCNWRQAMYYRYWMHKSDHNVYAHYGIRTKQYKLIYYYADALGQKGAVDEKYEPEWELFDLEKDPHELNSVYSDPAYTTIVEELRDELHRIQAEAGDERYTKDKDLTT